MAGLNFGGAVESQNQWIAVSNSLAVVALLPLAGASVARYRAHPCRFLFFFLCLGSATCSSLDTTIIFVSVLLRHPHQIRETTNRGGVPIRDPLTRYAT